MLLKNISENTVRERFPQDGTFELLPGETKDIPDHLAVLWLDDKRWFSGKSSVEVVKEPVKEEEVKAELPKPKKRVVK